MFYSFCLILYSAQVTCLEGNSFSARNIDIAVPVDVRGLSLSYDDKEGIPCSKFDKRRIFSKFSYVADFFKFYIIGVVIHILFKKYYFIVD